MKFLQAVKMEKDLKELEELDKNNALEDIDFQEEDTGKTTLYYAIEAGNKEIIDFLLRKSSKFSISDKTGRSPLT